MSVPALVVATNGGVLTAARTVLAVEIKALQALSGALDGTFECAVDMISSARGHVVVTGIGKSGHVGCKIAATLASTGTPAFFVHASEASHGDLGMVTSNNVILALSNSGETAELSNVVAFSRRFRIPLVAVTRNGSSTLASQSDLTLILPSVEEACPLGLAPTSSTTMMMALGDALAIALLKVKGFTQDNFRVFHPGGQLGSVLRRVREIMHRGNEVPLVPVGTIMSDVLIEMSTCGFGCAGVTDANGALVGIVTDGDLRRHMGPDFLECNVEDVMTRRPKTIGSDALAAEALGVMNRCKVGGLFVLDDSAPVGYVRMHDCLRAGIY